MRNPRIWWGYGLLLWGVGALVAGTSYQAFGYELKCAALNYCRATSSWEIAYLLISCYSFNALLMAHTYTSVTQYKRKFLQKSALFSSVLYTGLIVVGILTGDRFLVSYECLLVFLLPNVLIFILLTKRRVRQYRSLMNRRIMNTWYFFLLINIVYLVYLYFGVGSQLYQSTGIWFNENDVLHVSVDRLDATDPNKDHSAFARCRINQQKRSRSFFFYSSLSNIANMPLSSSGVNLRHFPFGRLPKLIFMIRSRLSLTIR